MFLTFWAEGAAKVAASNRLLPPEDPRHGMGVDALLGEDTYSHPDFQATWDTAVLQQCQSLGFAALVKTSEAASPKPDFTDIQQRPGKPFVPFVERLIAALERQVEEPGLREPLLKRLARSHSNPECRKIINSLPGDPSVVEMARACAMVSSGGPDMSALAVDLRSGQVPLGSGHKKKNKGRKQQGMPKAAGADAEFLCTRCHKAGHLASQCRSKFGADGWPLVGLANGKKRAKRNCASTKVIPQSSAPTQVCPGSSQATPTAPPEWMYVPPAQSS